MAMNLVDGRAGRPHINSDVLAVLNKSVIGEGDYVFDYGDNLSAVLTNANTVQIGTGALVVGGLRAINDAATNVTIQSGGQAQKRNDIVVARYNRTGEGDSIIESCDFAVVKGTPVSYGDATDPEIEQGDMPLWRIPIDGITPGEPEQMFELLPSIDSLRDLVSQTVEPIVFEKITGDQDFKIAGAVIGESMAVISFRWVNTGAFSQDAWTAGVQLAKMVGWKALFEQQSVVVDAVTAGGNGIIAVASAAGSNIAWRTSGGVSVDAGAWHEGQMVVAVERA